MKGRKTTGPPLKDPKTCKSKKMTMFAIVRLFGSNLKFTFFTIRQAPRGATPERKAFYLSDSLTALKGLAAQTF